MREWEGIKEKGGEVRGAEGRVWCGNSIYNLREDAPALPNTVGHGMCHGPSRGTFLSKQLTGLVALRKIKSDSHTYIIIKHNRLATW